MAKIDEDEFTTKYQGKLRTLQSRLKNLDMLKDQRAAWANARFKVTGRKPHATIYASAIQTLDLPPVDVPVPPRFIDDVVKALSLRIEKGEHAVAEAMRELAVDPRHKGRAR